LAFLTDMALTRHLCSFLLALESTICFLRSIFLRWIGLLISLFLQILGE